MSTFYVDFTTGDDDDSGLTEALAWKTIAKVNGETFAADDFILFKCGETWNETLIPSSSGTLGHPITFGAYGTGDDPIIDGTDLDYCIYDDTGEGFITIDGLECANPDIMGVQHFYWIPEVGAGSTPNWIIQNCTFTHCGVDLFGPNTIVQDNIFVGPQPVTSRASAIFISQPIATDCFVLRNTVSGFRARGIWICSAADTPTVNDNVVHDIDPEGSGINFDGYGLPITGTVTATGNVIYNCSYYGIFIENCSDGSNFSKNLIHDCVRPGIFVKNYPADPPDYGEQRGNHIGATFSYNIIYRCRNGIQLYDVAGVNIWNNVFHEGVGSGPHAIVLETNLTYCHSIDCRNNIMASGFDWGAVKVPHDAATWTAFFTEFDYNCIQANAMEEDGAHWRTLAALQAAGKALHCFSTDPGFVNAAGHDFHLLPNSPCINAGVDVGLTEDFEGNDIW